MNGYLRTCCPSYAYETADNCLEFLLVRRTRARFSMRSSTHDPMASSLLGGNVVFGVGTNTPSSAMHL
jgi:hypothetical protein